MVLTVNVTLEVLDESPGVVTVISGQGQNLRVLTQLPTKPWQTWVVLFSTAAVASVLCSTACLAP